MSLIASRSYSSSSSARASTSSRARASTSAMSLTGGMQLVGSGQTRISTAPFQMRAPSVYGGAGGYGTRISESHSVFSSGSLTSYADTAVINNEKVTMQNLNDRLASYLDKVRTLEAANRKLELQIREYYEKRSPALSRDFTKFFAIISDLRAQIMRRYTENQTISLQIDNAQLAADDFKTRFEMEQSMRLNVEGDVIRLRGVKDTFVLAVGDLKMQLESLREELAYLKSNHEEEMRLLRIQQTGEVDVQVDSAASVDLTKVLGEIREQYEAVVLKNKSELEQWFNTKMENLRTQIITCTTEVKTYHTELSDLKRSYQSLEISRQGFYAEIQYMQTNLEEVNNRCSFQLRQLQATITTLEMELQELKVSIEKQQSEYKLLLDIKMRLEMEIAEYRRLLDGEQTIQIQEKKAVIISKVVEEQKPHVERRVKTIVEEIVDGRVVSSSIDTQVEEIK